MAPETIKNEVKTVPEPPHVYVVTELRDQDI